MPYDRHGSPTAIPIASTSFPLTRHTAASASRSLKSRFFRRRSGAEIVAGGTSTCPILCYSCTVSKEHETFTIPAAVPAAYDAHGPIEADGWPDDDMIDPRALERDNLEG